MSNIALFDLDGSLADYVNQLCDDLNSLATPDEEIVTPKNLYLINKLPHIKKRLKLIKNQTGWWVNLKPIENGIKILNLAKEIGFDIHILTKGPTKAPIAWKEKLEWCQKNIPFEVGIHISTEKSMVYGKMLYDDYPQYMDSWLSKRPRGLGIMPVTDYNSYYSNAQVVNWNGQNIEEVVVALEKSYARN